MGSWPARREQEGPAPHLIALALGNLTRPVLLIFYDEIGLLAKFVLVGFSLAPFAQLCMQCIDLQLKRPSEQMARACLVNLQLQLFLRQ